MRTSSRFLASCVFATLVAPTGADAQDFRAAIDIVLAEPSYSSCDLFDPDDLGCAEVTTEFSGPGSAFAWVVVTRFTGFNNGIGGLQFGIDHAAVSGGDGGELTWSLCTGGGQVPDETWPAPGSGLAVVWPGGCYVPTGNEVARVGHFWVDGDFGCMVIEEDPRIGAAIFADCDAEQSEFWPPCLVGRDDFSDTGNGAFCADDGCFETVESCGIVQVPVERSTWGQVKGLF